MAHRRNALPLAIVFIAFGVATPAFAQEAIGGAVLIENDVRGETGGRRKPIALGDDVFRNQVVQTAAASRAKFLFRDLTNMSLGPDSRATLDKFVYNPDGTARTLTVNAARGAFRFFSGGSPSDAYVVRTPQAVIGVRGTTYDVRIADGRTTVVLQEGAVNVCVRDTARCRQLDQPGQSVVVSEDEIDGPIAPADKRWDFGDLCGGAAATFCARTSQFALRPLPTPPPAAKPPTRRAERAPPPRVRQPVQRVEPERPRVRRVASPVVIEPEEEEVIYVDRPVRGRRVFAPGFEGPRGWRPERGRLPGRDRPFADGRPNGRGPLVEGGRGPRPSIQRPQRPPTERPARGPNRPTGLDIR